MSKRRKRKAPVSVPVIAVGRNTEIHLVEVQDPYEPDKRLRVAKNCLTHPLDHLLARGVLEPDQKAAGDRFLAVYERAEIGGARAIDYSRVKVDVSFEHKGLDPRVGQAIDELEDIRALVGRRQFALLWEVIGRRRSPHEIAAEWDRTPIGSRRTREFIIDTLRASLNELAEHFEVYAQGRARRAC